MYRPNVVFQWLCISGIAGPQRITHRPFGASHVGPRPAQRRGRAMKIRQLIFWDLHLANTRLPQTAPPSAWKTAFGGFRWRSLLGGGVVDGRAM